MRNWFEDKLLYQKTRHRIYRGRNETAGLPNDLVDILTYEHHLLRSGQIGSNEWYELTHDQFIEPIINSNEKWRASIFKSNVKDQIKDGFW